MHMCTGLTLTPNHPSLNPRTNTQSREWLERIGNAPAAMGLAGGGSPALLLRVPWIEASVAGGKEVRACSGMSVYVGG